MPAADYQLFVRDLRVVSQDYPALTLSILLNTIYTVDRDQRAAMNAHKAVAELGLQ